VEMVLTTQGLSEPVWLLMVLGNLIRANFLLYSQGSFYMQSACLTVFSFRIVRKYGQL